jgi:hypothetical protein
MQLCGNNIPMMGNRLKDIIRRGFEFIERKPSREGR